MKKFDTPLRRILLQLVVSICLLLLYTSAYICLPQRVQAQTNETSLNSDEEIIYIDGDGVIRVIDTNHTGPTLVDWVSPDAGYVDFAVGDFNADGDYEIVGIKEEAGGGKLVVYDPVVLPGAMSGTSVTPRGIHWIKLYERTLGARPVLIETGNFNTEIPGDEIIYLTETGFLKSEMTIIARNVSLPSESTSREARNWYTHTSTAGSGNFDRVWQHISTGQMDEEGADEIVLVDSTRDTSDKGIRSKIAAFRVDDGGLASMQPFFERENAETSWRYAEIAEMNGRPGAEIVTSRSLVELLPDLHIFEYDMERGTIRDRGDGCPHKPHESLSCPDDVFSLHISPSPSWTFTADINGSGQDVAFFLRDVTAPRPRPNTTDNSASPTSVRLFGIDFAETLAFDLSADLQATVTVNGVSTVYTQTNTLIVPETYPGTIMLTDGRMIARDAVTTHWATYYDISRLNNFTGVQDPVPTRFYDLDLIYNLWERGAGGDTDGNGTDEVVVMRTDNIRTYSYQPDTSTNWVALRDDVVATNNRSLKLANLDRNGTLQFASELTTVNTPYTFVSPSCTPETLADATAPPLRIDIDSSQQITFQAFAMAMQAAQLDTGQLNTDQQNAEYEISAASPLVDWPSAVPWLKLSSPSTMVPTVLTLELIATGLQPNATYQTAQVFVRPSGSSGNEYRRQLSVSFLCAKTQLFLPIMN